MMLINVKWVAHNDDSVLVLLSHGVMFMLLTYRIHEALIILLPLRVLLFGKAADNLNILCYMRIIA